MCYFVEYGYVLLEFQDLGMESVTEDLARDVYHVSSIGIG